MKLFISWSGKLSHEFATIFNDWIQCVIPNSETFLSSSSIEPGTRWSTKIAEQLQECNAGIICLTSENIMSPWINFEAGALSKYIDNSRVIPLLIDISNSEISKSPLSQFQTLGIKENDLEKLLIELFEITGMQKSRVSKIFDRWWGDLDKKISSINFPDKEASTDNKYESLLQDFNQLNEGVKNQITQFKDILSDLTRPQEIKNNVDTSVYAKLIGLWLNPETGTQYYGVVIEDHLYLPYIYMNDDENLAHYFNIRMIGNRIYGRFLWFNREIRGFFYLDMINDTLLEGAWFYSHEVSLDNVEDINYYEGSGKKITWEKIVPSNKPSWLKTYLKEKLYQITE